MKQITQLLAIGLALGLTATVTQAQTQTVQTVTINLMGAQDAGTGATPVRITNKDILTALSGAGTFSPRARLVAITPDGGTTGIFVRDVVSRQNVDTDVSSYFSNSTVQSVSGNKGNSEISIQTFSFTSDTVSFNVQGFTMGNTKTMSETSSVNGTGTVDGSSPAVLRGTINIGPAKSE